MISMSFSSGSAAVMAAGPIDMPSLMAAMAGGFAMPISAKAVTMPTVVLHLSLAAAYALLSGGPALAASLYPGQHVIVSLTAAQAALLQGQPGPTAS